MKSELMPEERLKVAPDFEWPARFRRVPWQKRRNVGCGHMDQAVEEVVSWLDLAEVGFAELSLAEGNDPGAFLRFEWRGRRLVAACDTFSKQAANVHAIRAPINVLTTLASQGHWEMLKTVLNRMADSSERPLPSFEVAAEEALDCAGTELDSLSDAILEAAVRITRGERTGALRASVFEIPVVWGIAGRMLSIKIETPPSRPQGLALALAMLEFEPWTTSVELCTTYESNRWILKLSPKDLKSPLAKEWLYLHTLLRARRPELLQWLREDLV
jgi:hypothetical protein